MSLHPIERRSSTQNRVSSPTAENRAFVPRPTSLRNRIGREHRRTFGTVLFLTAAVIILLSTSSWAQYNETLLYQFCTSDHCPDGNGPGTATITFDSQGNIYGTTRGGGDLLGNGVVYKLPPPPGGSGPWTESVLYTFCSLTNCADGGNPYGGVI